MITCLISRYSNQRLFSLVLVSLLWSMSTYPNTALATCNDFDPNAEEYMDDGHVIHCRCRQGYVKWNAHCRLVEEVRTELEERLKNAQAGGRSALYSYSQLAVGQAASKASDALHSLDLLALAKGPDFKEQVVKVDIKLAQMLSAMGDCSQSDNELKTTCQNIKNFQKLVHETQAELDNLPASKH